MQKKRVNSKKKTTVRRSTSGVPRTAKRVLDIIDRFFVRHAYSDEAEDLWNVLTALRGPDSDTYSVKAVTTSPIRSRAFPKLWEMDKEHGNAPANFADPAKFKPNTRDNSTHFNWHIEAADRALRGMKR